MTLAAERFKLPKLVTATTWSNAYGALVDSARKARGGDPPRITNREALALIEATHALAPMVKAGWPLWYQFAAVAYGWDPKADRLDISRAQSDAPYDASALADLWLQMRDVYSALDGERADVPVRVDLSDDAWEDVISQGDIRTALAQDGAKARIVNVPHVDPATPAPAPARKPDQGNVVGLMLIVLGGLWLLGRMSGNSKQRRRRKKR